MNTCILTAKIIKYVDSYSFKNADTIEVILYTPNNKNQLNFLFIKAIATDRIANLVLDNMKKNKAFLYEGLIYIDKKIKLSNYMDKVVLKNCICMKILKVYNL